MRAGKLRHRLELQANSQAVDAYGDPRPSRNNAASWTTEATVWGEVRPLVGREAVEASRVVAELTHWVFIRYRAGVTPQKRIKWGSRIFNILSVANVEERGRELQIMCKEVLSSGLPSGA